MAKSLTFKQRVELRFIKRKIKKTLKKYNREFSEIMDENGIKSDYKLPLFIVYFVQQIVDKNAKPKEILRQLDEHGVFSSYSKLSNKLNSAEVVGNVSPKQAASEFADTIIKFIGERKTDLDKDKVKNLVYHVVKLVQLTDDAIPFEASAEKNLATHYLKRVGDAISVTKAITDIQGLLIDTIPTDANTLIVLINNLVRNLFKK
jgi:uncharacterized protein YaaR (DUF327 family)